MNPSLILDFIEFLLTNQIITPEQGRYLLEHSERWSPLLNYDADRVYYTGIVKEMFKEAD